MVRNTNGKGVSLKDELFNKEKVAYLGGLFAPAGNKFDADAFLQEVMKDMLSLGLKQRIVCIAKALETQLPCDFENACACIIKALPEELDPNKTDNDFGNFIFASLGEYVVRNGLKREFLSHSLNTLKEITKRFSMEDAIRHFLNTFPEETMKELTLWMDDTHYHVRRLVSEGTRPLLPWSGRIGIDITEVLPFLDSKDELDWIIRHALRTLLKQGHAGTLELLGYNINPSIYVSNTTVNRSILKMGEFLQFTFSISAQRSEKLMVDYVIEFVKANGMTKAKVFKLKKLNIKKGELVTLQKKHIFRKDATTFNLYPGLHQIKLQINGKQYTPQTFTLV